MNVAGFEDLLRIAREQPDPQRLLFVFTDVELPEGSTSEQRARFHAGQGGVLVPLMSVDKKPDELGTFAELVEESRQFGRDWSVVFVAALAGHDGLAPTGAEADRSLEYMIESIKTGSFGAFMPFDRQGQPLLFD